MRCNRHVSYLLVALATSLAATTGAATIFLDGTLAADCTGGNYNAATRSCNGSDGNAYRTIAALPLAPGDTLEIRGCPDSTTNCPDANWKYVGPLVAPQNTTIRGYNNEQVLVCSNQRACNLQYPRDAAGNVDMNAYQCNGGSAHWCDGGSNDGGYCTSSANCPGGSCSILNAHDWYGTESIKLGQDSVVDGVKTWGGIFMEDAHNTIIRNSDLGGCGVEKQGQVVRIQYTGNAQLRNNFIHHSCQNIDGAPNCSTRNNAWAVFGWDFQMTMENNELFDYFQGAIRLKDVGDTARPGTGGTTTVRNNYIRDSSFWTAEAGNGPYCFAGIGHDPDLDYVYFTQNICYRSSVMHDDPASIESIMYNNTFIDAYEASWSWHVDVPVTWFNNLSYVHTNGRHHFGLNNNSIANVSMDANLYWSQAPGYGRWDHNWSQRASDLAGWQSYTDGTGFSRDDLSVELDPQFVNLGCMATNDCLPEDFKRLAYNENFPAHNCGASVPYGGALGTCGARAGAYVTGTELIGVNPSTNRYWNLHHAPAAVACADGIDNDGDGNVDLADSNCSSASDTSESQCGDGVREPWAETCDGSDVGAETCATQGFTSGTLTCNASCSGFDTSQCVQLPPSNVTNLRIIN